MKSIKYYGVWLFMIFMLFSFVACGEDSSSGDSGSNSSTRTLEVGETETGHINQEGDVDTYRVRANARERYLRINCTENSSGDSNVVDLLVTVFEENENRERVRLFGKHEPDGAPVSADLELWIYINEPKDIYITVRDLMDDEHHDLAYFLTASFHDAAEGNHDFSTAQTLEVGADEPLIDNIAEVGQVDCFNFTPQASAVHSINVDHHIPDGHGTNVQLAISLYDYNGNRIQRIAAPFYTANDEENLYQYTILAYLEQYIDDDGNARPYYITVEDSDSLNLDEGAPYNVRVAEVSVDESFGNDAEDLATPIGTVGTEGIVAAGSIDYGCSSTSNADNHNGDTDWYQFQISDDGNYHLIKYTIGGGEGPIGTAPVRVMIYDSEGDSVAAYDYSPGRDAYENQFRVNAEDGTNYHISVAPANPKRVTGSSPYRVELVEVEINDAVEANDSNHSDFRVELTNGDEHTGYVSYYSDVDWYSISVGANEVLSVDLQTAAASIVDYQLSIWLDDGVTMKKKVTDMDGSDAATHLKTSYLFAEAGTYLIKVCDAQNNEGSEVAYTLRASTEQVPATVDGFVPGTTERPVYYGELGVEAGVQEDNYVELEVFSSVQPRYKAHPGLLDFRSMEQTAQADGTTVITTPWICGYVDYQGDRDFFKLDLNKLSSEAPETKWYYEIAVEMVVPANANNDVEYVWKLYHDGNGNNIVQENPESDDGPVTLIGDDSPQISGDALNLAVPAPQDDPFWIGSQWNGGDGTTWGGEEGKQFFVGISDFNFLQLPPWEDPQPNTEPDDDWGYGAAYYFRITLTYHPGVSWPEDTNPENLD